MRRTGGLVAEEIRGEPVSCIAGLRPGLPARELVLSKDPRSSRLLIGRRGEDAAQDPRGLDGAEVVLTLHAVISNGEFDEYWRFTSNASTKHLYPGIKQGQFTLGA